jgi:6-phosphogluconolactonase
MAEPDVVVLADEATITAEAAKRIAAALAGAVAERGRADWATTGGSMAPPIYRRLAAEPLREAIPWPAVHIWWGDDRFVPRDHPLSNVKPVDDILLGIVNLHPFPTGAAIGGSRDASWCAAQLGAELGTAGLPFVDGWPVFDMVLLGIGADGHLLSVFPGSDAFDSRELALAIPAPSHIEPHVERVTLNPGVLSVARSILVVAAGAAKAAAVGGALRGGRDPRALPARLARTANAVWIVDAAAGTELNALGPHRRGDQAR